MTSNQQCPLMLISYHIPSNVFSFTTCKLLNIKLIHLLTFSWSETQVPAQSLHKADPPSREAIAKSDPPLHYQWNSVATRSCSYRLILHNIQRICPPVTQKVACSGPGSCHLVPRQLQLVLIWFACMCHSVPTGHPECWLASCGWSKPYTRHWDLTIMLWMVNVTSRTWSSHTTTTTTHVCQWSSATANLLATHYKWGQPAAQQNMTVCCLGSKMEEQVLHWQNLRNYHLTVLHLNTQVKLQFTTMSVLKVNFWGKWKFSLYWHVWFQWIFWARNMLSDRELHHIVHWQYPEGQHHQNQWAYNGPLLCIYQSVRSPRKTNS